MAEPAPAHCKRCGKAVLEGTVEELWQMQLEPNEVPRDDALVLHRYGIPLVQIKLGLTGVSASRVFEGWAAEVAGWVTVAPHWCQHEKKLWGSI